MLAYTILTAAESALFDKVYVSTEDEKIANIARAYGATVHARPQELASDLVSATEVCLDVWRAVATPGNSYHAVVCLQPSSPLRSADDIRGAWQLFCDMDADFLVSVTFIDPHYFHWAVQPEGKWWRMFFGEKFMIERPLLPPVYRPNGAIKIGRAQPLLELRNFFGPKLQAYQMPEERSLHVAERFDFQIAEFLMRANQKTKNARTDYELSAQF